MIGFLKAAPFANLLYVFIETSDVAKYNGAAELLPWRTPCPDILAIVLLYG